MSGPRSTWPSRPGARRSTTSPPAGPWRLATDREEILEQVFDGQGTIARGMLSDASPWFSDHTAPARDVERARKQAEEYQEETGEPLVVQAAGAGRSRPSPTSPRSGGCSSPRPASTSSSSRSTSPRSSPPRSSASSRRRSSVGFTDPHPDLYEPLFRGIPAEQPAINTNITRYVNPVVTKAFADARETADVTRQVDDYRIVQEQLSVDDPYLFLVQVRSVAVVSPKVKDMTSWAAGSGAVVAGRRRRPRSRSPRSGSPRSRSITAGVPARSPGPVGRLRAMSEAELLPSRPPMRTERDSMGEVLVPGRGEVRRPDPAGGGELPDLGHARSTGA